MRFALMAWCGFLLAACHSAGLEQTAPTPENPGAPAPPSTRIAPSTDENGPLATIDIDYDFGRIEVRDAITDERHDTDVHGYIRYPETEPGPFPVILLMHGRHQTCETGIGQLPIPVGDDNCPDLAPVLAPADSYRGYDYLSQYLASHGYAVISVDANDINDNDGSPGNSDTGALARAELVLAHLDAFREIQRSGGRGLDALTGKLDFDRVGLMGHSRGGEGVARAVSLNQERAEPHLLRAVFALAPTDYNTQRVSGVYFAALLPYCDGDVEDLMGSFAYDNARYPTEGDDLPRFQILAMGANHNDFNTVWTSDDWEIHGSPNDPHCGRQAPTNERDTPASQRALGQFFMASFFRAFVGDERDYRAYWTGVDRVPDTLCPDMASACPGRYHLSIHPAAEQRRVIESLANPDNADTNALDQPNRYTGFTTVSLCETNGRAGEGCPSAEPTFAAARQLVLSWDGPATMRSELDGLDVRSFRSISLRAGVAHGDPNNGAGQDFSLALIDRTNTVHSVRASEVSAALFAPPGDPFSMRGAQKTTLNAVRWPLDAFTTVDLSQLQAVELRFDQTPAGTLQVTDLMFQRD